MKEGHSSSAEELKANYDKIRCISEKQEKRVRYRETKAGQLIVFYILILTVFFSSITRSNSTTSPFVSKKHRWIPFSLLLSVSVLFWLSIIANISAFLRAHYHYDLSLLELEITYDHFYRAQNGLKRQSQPERNQPQLLKPDAVILFERQAYVSGIVLALLAFTILMLYGCHTILQGDGQN